MGKLTTEDLRELLKAIKKHPKVIIPPAPGYDSGVHLINENEYLVISTDPCISVPEEWFGWLLIHYAASDVALFGARPEYCSVVLMGPPSTKAEVFTKIMEQACVATEELKMTIVTGHTGTYEGLSTLVGTCTAYGLVSRENLVTPGGAQAEDRIICTKQIGLETVVNFALTNKDLAESLFTVARTRELQNSVNLQTCVKEATLLAEIKGIHAMHDATEGGLVAALNEMAELSGVGFVLDLEKIPFVKEVNIMQRYFDLSQLELLSISSTGTILAAVDPKRKDNVLDELQKHGAEASAIGWFTKNKECLIRNGKEKITFPKVAKDPYAKVMMCAS